MDILVISDEPALGDTLASELPDLTFTPCRLEDAAAKLGTETFRLVISDGQPADVSDWHGKSDVAPVIVTRPVRLSDLLYTIALRLQSKSGAARPDMPLAQEYLLSPGERVIRKEDDSLRITLTEKEVDLLVCLLENAGASLTREELLEQVWGYSEGIATRTLETHIYRLRGKLRQAGNLFDILLSDEHGYRLALDAANISD